MTMKKYYVVYKNENDGDFEQIFVCMAEDKDHAQEQCLDFDPNAIIVEISIKKP